jgi:invasion protein IalB
MLLAALALAAVLASADSPAATSTAPAAGSTQTPPAKPPKPKKDPNRVVCEEASDTGSVIPKRVCHTQAEWDARAERDRATTGAFQNDHANN